MEKRISLGLATLPVSAVLAISAIFLRGTSIMPFPDVELWAETVTGSLYNIAQKIYLVTYVLPLFGFWALYKHLSGFERIEKISFWGFICSLWGIGLALPILGVFTYASPHLGQLFLDGNDALPDIINSIVSKDAMYLGVPAALLYSAGSILLGIGIFRAGVYPKIIPLILIPHGLLLSFGFSFPPVLVLGWVMLFASGFSLTYFVIVSKDENEDEDEIETDTPDFEKS
jgi:hypothetical protein